MEPARTRHALVSMILVLSSVLVAQDWNAGVATHFQTIGYPYGACGIPESVLAKDAADSLETGMSDIHYVALNVFNAPGDYRAPGSFGTRPLTGASLQWIGEYANGANCGRWVEIELGDECDGLNGGEAGNPVCHGGDGWFADGRNGAVLRALVTDQCSDNNVWCRDVPGHLDIRTQALNAFTLPSGTLVAPLATYSEGSGWTTSAWNNRKIRWKYIEAPTDEGDVRFWFAENSEVWWKKILVSNLKHGIHALEQWSRSSLDSVGEWLPATMDGDMGQAWVLPKTQATAILLRIKDANDRWIPGEFQVAFPEACGTKCSAVATRAEQVRLHAPTGIRNRNPKMHESKRKTPVLGQGFGIFRIDGTAVRGN